MKRSESIKTYNRPAPAEGLPESPELERAILGALILEPDQLPDVVEIVEISAFHGENNGKIYGAMLSMLERGDKIDLYTLSQRPELKGRDMLRYLSELTSVIGSGANVLDHARQLADTETRRRLCIFGYELAARAVSDPDGVVDWATSNITAIADRVSRPDDIASLSDVVRATLDDLERRQQARQAGECIGIPTGLQRLRLCQIHVIPRGMRRWPSGNGQKRCHATFCPCCGRVGCFACPVLVRNAFRPTGRAYAGRQLGCRFGSVSHR